MPGYEGTYHPLREHPYCNACGAERSNVELATASWSSWWWSWWTSSWWTSPSSPPPSLFQCSSCKMVWCQQKDFGHHYRVCRDIATLQAESDTKYKPIKRFFEPDEAGLVTNVLVDEGRPRDLFLRASLSYILTRTNLYWKQWSVAQQVQTRDAWKLVVDHQFHLERLSRRASIDTGIRVRMSLQFSMLSLNHDDLAYCYCLYWDRIYTMEMVNSRFRDVTREMRLVAVYESLLEEVDAFAATSSSRVLGPDGLAEVRQHLVGYAEGERKLADQRRQLIVLLDLVQARNASMVPALLYPEPLLWLPMPPALPPTGTPLEARFVLYLAMDVWRSPWMRCRRTQGVPRRWWRLGSADWSKTSPPVPSNSFAKEEEDYPARLVGGSGGNG